MHREPKFKIDNNFPCICCHPRGVHAGDFGGGRSYCNKRFVVDDDDDISCRCTQYIPDNLIYLEQIYNDKVNK